MLTAPLVLPRQAHARDHMSAHTSLGSWRLPFVCVLHGSPPPLHAALLARLAALTCPPLLLALAPHHAAALSTLLAHMALLRKTPSAEETRMEHIDCSPAAAAEPPAPYGDEKVANRETKVWHGATEKGP